jgi:Ni,Fe-hydrogenase maturation factor
MTDPRGPAGGAGASAPATRDAAPATGVLVVGYGNEMCGDDAVGLLAASRMSGDPRLRGATILAVRQLTPELSDDMRGAGLVVLVDAEAARDPGVIAIRHLAGRPAEDGAVAGPGEGTGAASQRDPLGALAAGGSTSHHVDPAALAALAHELWGAEPEVVIVSVGAVRLELGDDPSPAVVAAVPRVVDEVAAIVARYRRA